MQQLLQNLNNYYILNLSASVFENNLKTSKINKNKLIPRKNIFPLWFINITPLIAKKEKQIKKEETAIIKSSALLSIRPCRRSLIPLPPSKVSYGKRLNAPTTRLTSPQRLSLSIISIAIPIKILVNGALRLMIASLQLVSVSLPLTISPPATEKRISETLAPNMMIKKR